MTVCCVEKPSNFSFIEFPKAESGLSKDELGLALPNSRPLHW